MENNNKEWLWNNNSLIKPVYLEYFMKGHTVISQAIKYYSNEAKEGITKKLSLLKFNTVAAEFR